MKEFDEITIRLIKLADKVLLKDNLEIERSLKIKGKKKDKKRIIFYYTKEKDGTRWRDFLYHTYKMLNIEQKLKTETKIRKEGLGIDFLEEIPRVKHYFFLHEEPEEKVRKILNSKEFLRNLPQNITKNNKKLGIIAHEAKELEEYVKTYEINSFKEYYNKIKAKKKEELKKKLKKYFPKKITSWIYIMSKYQNKKKISEAIHIKTNETAEQKIIKEIKLKKNEKPTYIGIYFYKNERNYYFIENKHKLALVYPPTLTKAFFPIPPLSLATIKGYFEEKGDDPAIIDLEAICWEKNNPIESIDLSKLQENAREIFLEKKSKETEQIIQQIVAIGNLKDFEILAFSIMGVDSAISSILISQYLKKIKKLKIVFGGVYINIFYPFLKKFKCVDYLICGRGEEELYKLQQQKTTKNEKIIFSQIKKKKYFKTSFKGFPIKIYTKAIHHNTGKKKLIVPYELTYGCAFNCSFCTLSNYTGFVRKENNFVLKELKKISKISKNIFFYDSSINISKNFFDETTKTLSKIKDIKYSCYAIPNISFEDAKKLKESGCVNIRLAIETTDEKLLRQINKPIKDIKLFEESIKNLSKNEIKPHLLFITKIPNQTKENILKDFEFIKNNKERISGVSIYEYTLHKASADFKRLSTEKTRNKNVSGLPIDEFENYKHEVKGDDLYHLLRKLLKKERVFVLEPVAYEELSNHLIRYYARFY